MPPKNSYTSADTIAALRSMKTDGLSIRKAAKTYGIPESTLRSKFHGKLAISARIGRAAFLSMEEEEKIVNWANRMSKMGLTQTKSDILNVVKIFLDKDGRENPCTNNTPSKNWWHRFTKRHPNILYRCGLAADKLRVMAPEPRINNWFRDFEACLQKERALSMLLEPHILFADEEDTSLEEILGGVFVPSAAVQSPAMAPSASGDAQSSLSNQQVTFYATVDSGQLPQVPQQHLVHDETNVALDVILSGYSSPSTPSNSASGHLPETQMPAGDHAYVTRTEEEERREAVTMPYPVSGENMKEHELPSEAITVSEFFKYIRERKMKEVHDAKIQQRRMNGTTETDSSEEEDHAGLNSAKSDGLATNIMTSTKTDQRMDEEKMRKAKSKQKKERKKMSQQKNLEHVFEIMEGAHEIHLQRQKNQLRLERKKAKQKKLEKLDGTKKKQVRRKRTVTKKTKKKEEKENEAESPRKDMIVEAKDKVRTETNIKTVTTDESIYVCPACSKASGDDEKWIRCDHCIRWLHLSCTSMFLLKGIDLASFDYRCKFC